MKKTMLRLGYSPVCHPIVDELSPADCSCKVDRRDTGQSVCCRLCDKYCIFGQCHLVSHSSGKNGYESGNNRRIDEQQRESGMGQESVRHGLE